MKKLNFLFLFLFFIFVFLIIRSNFLYDIRLFIREAYKNIKTTGAIMPISKKASHIVFKNIYTHIKLNNLDNINILEIGAGTGALSEYIINRLIENKIKFNITLVELNKVFCDFLNKKFKRDIENNIVKIYCQDFCNFKSDVKYDFIISTLPFNSVGFESDVVKLIFDKYKNLLNKKGFIFWVEYALLGKILIIFGNEKYKLNYLKKHDIINKFIKDFNLKYQFVLFNIPPVYLYFAEPKN